MSAKNQRSQRNRFSFRVREIGLMDDEFDEGALYDITGLNFFNTSRWTLKRIKSHATDDNNLLYQNFVEYLNGYSENVKECSMFPRDINRVAP